MLIPVEGKQPLDLGGGRFVLMSRSTYLLVEVGTKWIPERANIASREILAVLSDARIKYRTFNDGRGIPLVRTVSALSFHRWCIQRACRRS